jgi:acetylornithine/LysW-gamma-L-lysine aminotransferase
MSLNDPVSVEDAHLARVYSKKPLTIVRGTGCLVYDAGGREFVDCAGGYGTCIVGHAHPRVVEAITRQASKLTSCHGSVYNDARADFVKKLTSIAPSELDRAFLANSGAEAVEAAIKIARKSTGRRQIIAVKGGYHGKTHGALSATWDPKYRKSFEPLLPGFSHIPFNDTEAAKSAVTTEAAAVLVEPIQGEGGVRISSLDWLALLRDLTRDTGSLLILDEIQTGFGRTGKMFAGEHFHVRPDILCLGKGIASGLPIGVTLAGDCLKGFVEKGEGLASCVPIYVDSIPQVDPQARAARSRAVASAQAGHGCAGRAGVGGRSSNYRRALRGSSSRECCQRGEILPTGPGQAAT